MQHDEQDEAKQPIPKIYAYTLQKPTGLFTMKSRGHSGGIPAEPHLMRKEVAL